MPFGRVCRLDIDNLLSVEGLRTTFKIERSHTPGSNKGEIEVYNLAQTSRSKLAKASAVRLVAGYTGDEGIIYQGNVRRVTNAKDGTEFVTTFTLGDAAYLLGDFRIRTTYAKGTKYVDILKDIGDKLHVDTKNARAEVLKLDKRTNATTTDKAITLSGDADAALSKLIRTLGLDYSIQHDELVVTLPGRARSNATAILLSPATGLVGSADISEKGKITADAILSHRLAPAELVQVESDNVNGFFRIDRVRYVGDTHGDTWQAQMDLRSVL